jgi:hypothetical protein
MDEEILNHLAERLGDKISEALEEIAYALSDKLGDLAKKDIIQTQIMPAPGWQIVRSYFNDDGDFVFVQTPLIGWLVSGGTAEPIYWDEKVKVFPGEDDKLDDCRGYATSILLSPIEKLDEKMRKHLEGKATHKSGYPCWSKKYRLETSRQIASVLGNSCEGLSEEELANAYGVNEYMGHALGDMKKDGLIIEDDEHRFSLTKKGLEWAAQKTVVA